MKMPGISYFVVLLMISILGSYVRANTSESDEIVISFDSLFPQTPYKETLGMCMQSLGYLEHMLSEHESKDLFVRTVWHDAFIGKLFLAHEKMTHLMKEVSLGHIVADDNLSYLEALVSHIFSMYTEKMAEKNQNKQVISLLLEMGKFFQQ